MTEISSKRIIKRFQNGLIIALVIILIGGIINYRFNQFEINKQGVFKPINLISQTQIVYESLHAPYNSANQNIFECNNKYHAILSEKISKALNLSLSDGQNKLNQAWADLNLKDDKTSCGSFKEALNNALKIQSDQSQSKENIDDQIKLLLTQNLNWSNQILCVYAKDQDGSFLLSGSQSLCRSNQLSFSDDLTSRKLLKTGIQPIIAIAKNRAKDINKGKSKFLTLTIDSSLQTLFNNFINCPNNSAKCDLSIKNAFEDVDYATFALLDADTSEVLSVGCYGSLCNQSPYSDLGLLRGAYIEAPPASIAKLFFSYNISKSNLVNNQELALQIKTSGELDNKVSKRNEWWERQSICDGNKKLFNCSVPKDTAEYAKIVGLNQDCEDIHNKSCGFGDILRPLDINQFNPTIGRILVSIGQNSYYLDNRKLKSNFIAWKDYDQVREGSVKIKQGEIGAFDNTSLVIQSVIGAGNNRITSLGVAKIASAIYQGSQNGQITNLKFFMESESKKFSVSKEASVAVLNGMQKVLTPAEKNWEGAGTAAKAFKTVFNTECINDCPLYAKTGTVSMKDVHYSGTTLFSAILEKKKLAKLLSNKEINDKRNYAIGIISHSKKKNVEHKASKLGMLLIKNIIEED